MKDKSNVHVDHIKLIKDEYLRVLEEKNLDKSIIFTRCLFLATVLFFGIIGLTALLLF